MASMQNTQKWPTHKLYYERIKQQQRSSTIYSLKIHHKQIVHHQENNVSTINHRKRNYLETFTYNSLSTNSSQHSSKHHNGVKTVYGYVLKPIGSLHCLIHDLCEHKIPVKIVRAVTSVEPYYLSGYANIIHDFELPLPRPVVKHLLKH